MVEYYKSLVRSGVPLEHVIDLIEKHIKGIENLTSQQVSDGEKATALLQLREYLDSIKAA